MAIRRNDGARTIITPRSPAKQMVDDAAKSRLIIYMSISITGRRGVADDGAMDIVDDTTPILRRPNDEAEPQCTVSRDIL